MEEPLRLDKWLVQNGLVESREKARQMIEAGVVKVNGNVVTKPAFLVVESNTIVVTEKVLRYVSRGALKLEKAIRTFGLQLAEKVVLDIGASTGGFTDCSLQHGARKVFAIDVGTDQLHPSLRSDDRIRYWEQLHIKDLKPGDLGEPVDLIVIDVSFISLTLVFPYLDQFLQPDGKIIALIKPQFEVGPKVHLKGGIVKDRKLRKQAVLDVMKSAASFGFYLQDIVPTDADPSVKNVEYMAMFDRRLPGLHDSLVWKKAELT
ncbi:TlyA family RNA methyltransferase [Flavihumibacter rivuli]|uniref:TlyA family RNA methyltransferase n=1 Tax=Flavihumibacter rivuli TaxID=2838156 RepID=UPI001BDE1745|nr:TlyA family RNA methyltransferase [Flavihumibacter rivuli]ULQ56116.1 TlyA family RNA methyltransferase [Flavihumibacter rivuli]